MGMGGQTVANYFRRAGVPAACWCRIDEVLHEPNEYCVVDYMIEDAKVFAHVALQ
jgi:succinyl-diaminopimelate desuccinylase